MPDQSSQQLKTAVKPQIETDIERKKALLAKVRTNREHMLANRGSVKNPKPNKHYVWVNINDHRQIDFQSQGYTLCKDPDIKSAWIKPDGSHQRGDLVLYEIDKELHEALKLDEELRALEAVAAPKHALHSAVERVGGAVYEPTPR